MISLSGLCRDDFLCFIQPIHAILFFYFSGYILILNIHHISDPLFLVNFCDFIIFYFHCLNIFWLFLPLLDHDRGENSGKLGERH